MRVLLLLAFVGVFGEEIEVAPSSVTVPAVLDSVASGSNPVGAVELVGSARPSVVPGDAAALLLPSGIAAEEPLHGSLADSEARGLPAQALAAEKGLDGANRPSPSPAAPSGAPGKPAEDSSADAAAGGGGALARRRQFRVFPVLVAGILFYMLLRAVGIPLSSVFSLSSLFGSGSSGGGGGSGGSSGGSGPLGLAKTGGDTRALKIVSTQRLSPSTCLHLVRIGLGEAAGGGPSAYRDVLVTECLPGVTAQIAFLAGGPGAAASVPVAAAAALS